MKVVFSWLAALAVACSIAGCGGGSSSSQPTNVVAVPHDSSATISWNTDSGVEYWLWVATTPGVSSDNCANTPGCVIKRGVSSPYLLTGLLNGTSYTVVVNGRVNGGPGGPDSAPVTFTPRAAGTTWTAGPPLGSANLRGVAFATATATTGNTYVTVGQGGTIYSSSNAVTWTLRNSGTTANLNAVVFAGSQFVAAGDGGTILTSTDGITWTTVASGTANNLYGLSLTGAFVIAVGASGTMLSSTDAGKTWTVQKPVTANDLYSVTVSSSSVFVIVGAQGTVLSGNNGTTWTVQNSQTTQDLRSVVAGRVTLVNTFVAVGAAGTMISSTDGAKWTVQPSLAANALNAMVFGSQWVVVGSGGAIFYSIDGVTWVPTASGTTSDLYAVAFTGVAAANLQNAYVAVGAAGANTTSF